jgi:hypothetical protein
VGEAAVAVAVKALLQLLFTTTTIQSSSTILPRGAQIAILEVEVSTATAATSRQGAGGRQTGRPLPGALPFSARAAPAASVALWLTARRGWSSGG